MPPASAVRAGRAFDRGGGVLTLDLFEIELRLKLCGPESVSRRSREPQPLPAPRRDAPPVPLTQDSPAQCEGVDLPAY
jgi:hypothetical protein